MLASQRARMLGAMADAVAAKGYAGATVADVVAGAGVSRKTGPRALERRAEVLRRFATLFRSLHEEALRQFPRLAPVPEPIYVAAVGAINELVSDFAREGRMDALPELEDTLLYLQVALFAGRDTAADLGLGAQQRAVHLLEFGYARR